MNGRRHGRSLLVHMRFQSCCAPPDFDLVIMRVLVVVVMVVIMTMSMVVMLVLMRVLMIMHVLVIMVVTSAGAIRTVIFANLAHASHPQSCRAEQRQRARWHSSAQWAHPN